MNPLDVVMRHVAWRDRCLNLQPSENHPSRAVRRALASDMEFRYSMEIHGVIHGENVDNAYGGTRFMEEVLHLTEKLACEVFGVRCAEVRPLSGHLAAMAVLGTLVPRGGKVMAIPPEHGGYDGYVSGYLPDLLGFEYHPIPFNPPTGEVNYEALADEARRVKPDVILLGASYIAFPYDLGYVMDVAEDVGAEVVYDASHGLGLVAGGEFQSDINRVKVFYGSTHKSFPGPQGGIILTNDEEFCHKVSSSLLWRYQDNFHPGRVAALGVALWEMSRVGPAYARCVRRCSRKLAAELAERGVPLKYAPSYTDSHQILMDAVRLRERYSMGPSAISHLLEEQDIIIDRVGRIGTAELAWKGYAPEDMERVAEAVAGAIHGGNVRGLVSAIVGKWDGLTLGDRLHKI